MRWRAIGLAVLVNSALALLAIGAGPYDGKWVGQGSGAGCAVVIANLTVSDGVATGGMSSGATYPKGGKIGPDGNVTLITRRGASHAAVFAGDRFELHADTQNCGHVDIVGHRAN
jgi:hypothetical protein